MYSVGLSPVVPGLTPTDGFVSARTQNRGITPAAPKRPHGPTMSINGGGSRSQAKTIKSETSTSRNPFKNLIKSKNNQVKFEKNPLFKENLEYVISKNNGQLVIEDLRLNAGNGE